MNRSGLDNDLVVAFGKHVSVEFRYLLQKRSCRFRLLWQPEQPGEAEPISDENSILDRITATDQEALSPVAPHWREVECIQQRDRVGRPGIAQPVLNRASNIPPLARMIGPRSRHILRLVGHNLALLRNRFDG